MHSAARGVADGLDVSCEVVARDVGVFAVHAVIEKFANLDALHEIRHAAYVVGMKVGDEHLVELRDACIFHRLLNALGVAAVVAGPAGIDQHRSAGRRNNQRGLAAFHIDGVDGKIGVCRLRGLGSSRARQDATNEREGNGESCGGQERRAAESGRNGAYHLPMSVNAGTDTVELLERRLPSAARMRIGEPAGAGRSQILLDFRCW